MGKTLFVIFTIDSIDFLVYRISEVFEQSMPDPSSGVDDTSPGTVAGKGFVELWQLVLTNQTPGPAARH